MGEVQSGEKKGTITAWYGTGEAATKAYTLEVDGIEYNVVPYTLVTFRDASGRLSDLQTGDPVRLWFSGVPEYLWISQIYIDRDSARHKN